MTPRTSAGYPTGKLPLWVVSRSWTWKSLWGSEEDRMRNPAIVTLSFSTDIFYDLVPEAYKCRQENGKAISNYTCRTGLPRPPQNKLHSGPTFWEQSKLVFHSPSPSPFFSWWEFRPWKKTLAPPPSSLQTSPRRLYPDFKNLNATPWKGNGVLGMRLYSRPSLRLQIHYFHDYNSTNCPFTATDHCYWCENAKSRVVFT